MIQQRTVTFTGNETAALITQEVEPRLGPTEVAGRTLASLVSPGTELNGSYLGQNFPRTPGYSAVFEVEHVGTDVEGVARGDHLYAMGKHSSFQQFDIKETLPVPAGLSPDVAVYCRLMGVTMTTLVTTQARPPDIVLVTGLGPVGNLGAQNFLASGYSVIGCDPDGQRRALATSLGIEQVVPSVPVDDAEWAGKVAMVLDCSGHEQAVVDGARTLRRHGELVLVGAPWARRTELYAHDLLESVFFKYVQIRSGWEWRLPHHSDPFQQRSVFDNFATALAWLAAGKVRTTGLGTMAFPADCQDAYQDLLHKKSDAPTVVFDWSQ